MTEQYMVDGSQLELNAERQLSFMLCLNFHFAKGLKVNAHDRLSLLCRTYLKTKGASLAAAGLLGFRMTGKGVILITFEDKVPSSGGPQSLTVRASFGGYDSLNDPEARRLMGQYNPDESTLVCFADQTSGSLTYIEVPHARYAPATELRNFTLVKTALELKAIMSRLGQDAGSWLMMGDENSPALKNYKGVWESRPRTADSRVIHLPGTIVFD